MTPTQKTRFWVEHAAFGFARQGGIWKQYAGLLSAASDCMDGFWFDLQSCSLHDPK
jgi:hypothetical protein